VHGDKWEGMMLEVARVFVVILATALVYIVVPLGKEDRYNGRRN
jgi:hypothetical protein